MASTAFTDIDWTNYKRAQDCIAQGALTNSKRPECFVKGVYPTHATKGIGPWLLCGKDRYLDFICGLGVHLLGMGHDELANAGARGLREGGVLSLSSEAELDVAEKLKEFFPWATHWKFFKTGSDACSAALRIARGFTGKIFARSEGYHGTHDEFVSLTPPAIGITGVYRINPLIGGREITSSVAAVIVEPIMTSMSETRIEWLKNLRRECTRTGTILIFDEIITEFRFPKHSVSAHLGIEPVLICIGKALGGGMPLAAVGGRKEIMNGSEYFFSSTFAGDIASLHTAHKFLTLMQTKFKIDELWDRANAFQVKFNGLTHGVVQLEGYGTRAVFTGDELKKALFWQESIKAGLLFGASFFMGFRHLTELDTVLSTVSDIAIRIRTGSVKLQGDLPQSPFANRMRGNA